MPMTVLMLLVLALAAAVGAPARAEVSFEGLSRTTERVVRGNLDLADEPCDVADVRLRRLFRRADGQIRRALEVYGYYAPTIEKRLEQGGDCWEARFQVVRGPRVQLRRITVRVSGPGATDPALARLVADRPFVAGEGLNQRAYDSYKSTISSLARQRGYFEGRWADSRIDVHPEALAADITLDYDSGERYRFGAVEFEQAVLDAGLVAGFVDFAPGEPYDAEAVNRLYTALLVSGYFQGVDVRTTPRPAPDRDVVVSVSLTPATPRTWTAGVGYATDVGAKLRMGYLNTRRNEKGHQLELNSSIAEILGEVTASYRFPLGDPRAEWLSLDAGFRYENPEDSRSQQYRFGVKDIRRRGDLWRETRFVDLSVEDYTIGTVRDTSTLLIPGLSWSRQDELLPVRPQAASRISFQVSGTGQFLGSDTDFLQVETAGKVIRPLWKGGRVLARAEVGATVKDELTELPFSVRYFAGGDYSVRGYDYKTLGPADENGVVIGGAHRLAASVEVDQQFRQNWAAAAFLDMGNAFDSFKDMSLKSGAGVGVRWYSPLGPVRLDVAFPLDDNAPDSFRLHITLGPEL